MPEGKVNHRFSLCASITALGEELKIGPKQEISKLSGIFIAVRGKAEKRVPE